MHVDYATGVAGAEHQLKSDIGGSHNSSIEESESTHYRLIEQDVVEVIATVLLCCNNQSQHTEGIEVSVLLHIHNRKVPCRPASLVDDLIDKFVRVLEGQLCNLLQNALAQGRPLLHEVDVRVHEAHDELEPHLCTQEHSSLKG